MKESIKETQLIKESDIYEISDFFKIISDPTRLKIILSLNNKELNVTEITELMNLTKSTISHQLRTLKDHKIVKFRKVGKNVIYSLDDEHVSQIINNASIHLKEDR